MLGAALSKTTGFLDRRFILGLLAPSVGFWVGLAGLVVPAWGTGRVAAWWATFDGAWQALFVSGAVAAVVLFATLLGSHVVGIMRLWEGYWPGRAGRRLARLGARWQLRRWNRLDLQDPDDYLRRYREFPRSPDDLLPTRLGNVLRAAEQYPGDPERYHVDAVFFWPRIYLVLPGSTRHEVEEARATLDQLVVVATLATAFAGVAVGAAVWPGLPIMVWAPAVAGAVLAVASSYRAAVNAAAEFGELVRSCFDLYRHALLDHLGFARPATIEEERALWQAVQQQLYRRAADRPELLRYADPAERGPAGDT
jgi:hypothetical protein